MLHNGADFRGANLKGANFNGALLDASRKLLGEARLSYALVWGMAALMVLASIFLFRFVKKEKLAPRIAHVTQSLREKNNAYYNPIRINGGCFLHFYSS